MATWIRTCQECGNQQVDKEPQPMGNTTLAYENRKCKKCKSTALDYGTYPSRFNASEE